MPRPADMPALRGLPNPNTTPLPNCIVDEYLPFFTGAELKVILYLVRRTLGFHKTRDAISLNQICNGIVRKDGRRLDRGTGLHKSTACDALNALVNWGMIKRITRRDPVRGDLPTEYVLWIEGEPGDEPADMESVDSSRHPAPDPGSGAPARGRRRRERGEEEVRAMTVSGSPDTPLTAVLTPPVSSLSDTPLSGLPDAPVSPRTDRQYPASQKKEEQSHSNVRSASPPSAVERRRQGLRDSDVGADGVVQFGLGETNGGTSCASGDHAVMSDRTRTTGSTGVAPVYDPARDELHRFAEVLAQEFNDQAPFRATLSRLVNLYHGAGLPLEVFADQVDAARQRTKERTAAIRPPSGGQAKKNKMPYFFALLEELLGLRAPPSFPTTEPGRGDAQQGDAPVTVAVREPVCHRPVPASSTGDGPITRTLPLAQPAAAPPAAVVPEDARVIREVVREFSRQFCGYDAATALGNWAVTLWQRSGVSQQRFLEVAQTVSEELVRDEAGAVTAPLFQSRLADALVPSDGEQSPCIPGIVKLSSGP